MGNYVRKTIEKTLEENFLETTTLVKTIANQLEYCRSNRILYDYKVSEFMTQSNDRNIDITIKPMRSIEMIQLKFKVNRSG